MADKLPKFILIKSLLFSDYASYIYAPEAANRYVFFKEKNKFSQLAKIEVEPASIDGKYVHLRFCRRNKYWARRGADEDDHWIVAGSDQPDEDTSKSTCTMFEPKFGDDGFLYLTHVQSGRRVRTDDGSGGDMTGCVYVDDDDDVHGERLRDHGFTYEDWEALFKLPKNVAFRGDDGKYLQISWDGDLANLEFSAEFGNTKLAFCEFHLLQDGNFRIKSTSLDKFWRRKLDDWINSDSNDEDDMDTLFWPVKVDSGTIALRSAGNNQFCVRNSGNYLVASVSTIVKEARLRVTELVSIRKIDNIRYRMEDARVYYKKDLNINIANRYNEFDTDFTEEVKFDNIDQRSYSFGDSFFVTADLHTTIRVGTPKIVNGKVEVFPDEVNSFEWGETTIIHHLVKDTYTVTMTPKSRVRVYWIATQGKYSIPFSYTRRDKTYDGQYITSQHNDGIIHGVNYYNLRFEEETVLEKILSPTRLASASDF